jgi:hypothetical protein
MLPLKAPVPGTGWGCVVCNLPLDGATYLACDRCVRKQKGPREVICGYPSERKRMAIGVLSDEPFEHDMSLHDPGD